MLGAIQQITPRQSRGEEVIGPFFFLSVPDFQFQNLNHSKALIRHPPPPRPPCQSFSILLIVKICTLSNPHSFPTELQNAKQVMGVNMADVSF